MNKLLAAVAGLSMFLSGCAGSVNGTVGGVSLSVADAIFALLKDDAGKTNGAVVFLSDKPRICDTMKANREAKNATGLFIAFFRVTDTAALAPDVGDYTVIEGTPSGAGSFAYSGFQRTDANCTNTLSSSASGGKSGVVKVTNFKGEANGNASGTFDITFGAGDKVNGSFNASYCELPNTSEDANCE